MSPQLRLLAGGSGLLLAYFAVPVELSNDAVFRIIVAVLGLAGTTAIILHTVRRQLHEEDSPLWTLALALMGGVLAFAFADYLIAYTSPGEFADLHTRLDALYFALTTLATVGYGDVHAVGQLARAAVSIQLVFNILVITTAASVIASQLRSRLQR